MRARPPICAHSTTRHKPAQPHSHRPIHQPCKRTATNTPTHQSISPPNNGSHAARPSSHHPAGVVWVGASVWLVGCLAGRCLACLLGGRLVSASLAVSSAGPTKRGLASMRVSGPVCAWLFGRLVGWLVSCRASRLARRDRRRPRLRRGNQRAESLTVAWHVASAAGRVSGRARRAGGRAGGAGGRQRATTALALGAVPHHLHRCNLHLACATCAATASLPVSLASSPHLLDSVAGDAVNTAPGAKTVADERDVMISNSSCVRPGGLAHGSQ